MELTKKHLGLIEYQLSTFDVDRSVEDDLRSAGNFGLLRAQRTYPDTGNTAKFETFAVTCIRNAMLNELRDLSTKKATIFQNVDSGIVEETAMDTNNTEEQILAQEAQTEAWKRVIALLPSLTERQLYILRHRIHCATEDEETQQEIADRFKCHQSTIMREEKKLYGNLSQAS